MEHKIKKGYFLAPKCYTFQTEDDCQIIKQKGLAKDFVDKEWFESQYADIYRTKQISVVSNFRIVWNNLDVTKKEIPVTLGLKVGNKRDILKDNNKNWVDTQPKVLIDYGGQDNSCLKFDLKILREQYAMKEIEYKQSIASQDSVIASQKAELAKMLEDIQRLSDKVTEEPVMSPLTESPTGLEQPNLYNNPTEGKKPKVNDTS